MSQPLQKTLVPKTLRRSLLTAVGTLLAAAVAGKYLSRGQAAQTSAQATQSEAAQPQAAQAQAGSGPVSQPLSAVQSEPPAGVPELHFTTAEGAARSLADYAGKGIVLNFWATWCVPCVSEMPALDSLSRAAAEKNIVVLPVSLDHNGANAVKPFYLARSITSLPVLLDPHADAMASQKLEGIPTTLIIDRKGREVARVQGPVQWDAPDAVALLAKLVG